MGKYKMVYKGFLSYSILWTYLTFSLMYACTHLLLEIGLVNVSIEDTMGWDG